MVLRTGCPPSSYWAGTLVLLRTMCWESLLFFHIDQLIFCFTFQCLGVLFSSIYFQRVFFSNGFLRSGLLPECHSLIWHLRHTHVLLVEGFLSTSQCYPFKTILILFWHIISNTQPIRIIIIEYILFSIYTKIYSYLFLFVGVNKQFVVLILGIF